jgi:hypothetical protein
LFAAIVSALLRLRADGDDVGPFADGFIAAEETQAILSDFGAARDERRASIGDEASEGCGY